MIILGIETSCDETAVCVVEASGGVESPIFNVRGNGLFSQVALHAEYGGVFPNLAKREHAKNLPLLLQKALFEAGLWLDGISEIPQSKWQKAEEILSKEQGLFEVFKQSLEHISRPNIDMIAVTAGPGLEPALWVGISFAQALGAIWDIPVRPTNHMEGHIASVLLHTDTSATPQHAVMFPALALLISGGHTELVEMNNWGVYKKIGQTRDDAVGEAFDKVARMLALPYPGGPEISRRAQSAREKNTPRIFSLPRPMIHSHDLDFSFSGLKTAVLYTLRDNPGLTEDAILDLCREFEDAVTDVLISKTRSVLQTLSSQTLIIAGGVVANSYIRESFTKLITEEFPHVTLRIPTKDMSTDNALMIASAGYIEYLLHPEQEPTPIKAEGNMSF